jgi:peptide/nickel transport system substrate-binding protein
MRSFVKTKTLHIVELLLLAALLCAGIQAAMAEENTLNMSVGKMLELGTDPTVTDTLLPDIGGSQPYHYWTHFSPLISLDSNASIVPWMAESYEVSNDYRTITFYLRKGVKFADGTPLNASVLKFNFDRIITYGLDDYAGKSSTRKWNIFMKYDNSEAADEYTFKIHFTQGWLNMPLEFAKSGIYGNFISPGDVDPAWNIKGILKQDKKYNGLGAYYVDENESIPKQKVVLERRHSWQDDLNFHRPKLDKIVLNLITDSRVAVMALEKGDINYICRYWNVPLDMLRDLKNNPKITIRTKPQTRLFYIYTAWWKEPFNGTDGILLRKAINYALNRNEIVEGAFNGYALPATDAMLLSSSRQDTPECCHKGYDYDLDKAKKLLADAGWKDTDGDGILDKDGKALNLNLIIQDTPDLWWMKDLALVVQSQLKNVGIKIQIQALDGGGKLEAQKKGNYDLVMHYLVGRTNPPAEEFKSFNLKGVVYNFYSNQNKTLETIVENAQMTLSEEERDRYLCQACNILYEEAGTIPLVYEVQYAAMNERLKGFKMGPSQDTYFMDHIEECWIEG